MSRGTCAVIDLAALRHNFDVIKKRVGATKILTVVKADGYGHGMTSIARALPKSDGFGVATLDEALLLRAAGITQKIVMLEGALSLEELNLASEAGIDVVVHQLEQVAEIEQAELTVPLCVWLKVDTGMHRLGLEPEDVYDVCRRLVACTYVSNITLMSHFSCADDPSSPKSDQQYQLFKKLKAQLMAAFFDDDVASELSASLANSAGVFQNDSFHFDWVRPGIALYGASPLINKSAQELNLKPVMALVSRVIALRLIRKGESVGYGASWTAERDTRTAIVAIGYGDGYPRHVEQGVKVIISGVACDIIGRVSMDMIAVDVSNVGTVALKDSVMLWGNQLPVEDVASWAGTINYELLCQVTDRVDHRYLNIEE